MVVFQRHKLSLTTINTNKAKERVHLDESTFILTSCLLPHHPLNLWNKVVKLITMYTYS